jgi:DNA-binding TFAR19-related protein (PDSD5 family)
MSYDDELTNLREKRKREILAQKLKKELAQKKQEETILKEKERLIKATKIVNSFLEPEAVVYLNWLSQNKPVIAQKIKDVIIMLAYQKELLRPLSKIDVMKLERSFSGQESSIKVKKRGEDAVDLSQNLKKSNKSS